MPLSRGSAVARRRSHKAGSTWSGMLVSFDRVQWLDASRRGDSSRLSRPQHGHPQRVLGRALIFDRSLGIPDSGARDRLSNPSSESACDLSRLSWCVPCLTREGRSRGGSPFCPLGGSFKAGAVAALCRRGIRSVPSVRRKRTVRRRIYGGSYLIYQICPLVGRGL